MTYNYQLNKDSTKTDQRSKQPLIILCLFMLLVSIPNISMADEIITIGTGNETGEHVPIEPYYCYTYSQSVYLQSEINATGPGYIDAIEFQYNGYCAWTDDIKVYVGHTSGTYFSTWKPLSTMTLVYSGTYSVGSTAGWYKITFDEPFYYNNSDNLVFAVDENTGYYHSSCCDFYTTDYSSNVSIYFYDDYYNPDPANPPAGYVTDNRPNIKIHLGDELYKYPMNAGVGDNVKIGGKLKIGERIILENYEDPQIGDQVEIYNSYNGEHETSQLYIKTTNDMLYRFNKDGFHSDGKISSIGDISTQGNIDTDGIITANKFKVGKWEIESTPDYVFKKDYKLRSLKEIEEYIEKNKHLPEVPSAEQMSKDGVDLAKMNMILLKKIEELHLYTIEQNKKLEEQNKKIEKLEKKVDALKR